MSTTETLTSTQIRSSGDRPAARLSTRFLRSELLLIFGRRRNQAGLLVLALVPIAIAIAVKVAAPGGGGPDFLNLITLNGLFVAFAALAVEITMFLPLAVAMLAGDAVAGEAHLGTLRYLLTVPVNRTRLLLVKYLSLCIGSAIAVLMVAVVGSVFGGILFGVGPMLTLSGTEIGFGTAIVRLALAVLYLTAGLCALAAVGLFLSTLTEQPIAVTIAVMIFVILCTIAITVPQLSWLHPWLLTDHFGAVADVLREPIAWSAMLKGYGLDAVYALVFWLAAWARFTTKDITN